MYTIQLMSGNGMDQTTASVWAYTPVFIIEVLNSEGTNESSAYFLSLAIQYAILIVLQL